LIKIEADKQKLATSFPVAIVVSRFNEDITQALQKGAIEQLKACGISETDITVVGVPGAIEIPLVAKRLAKTNQYSALIALGAVVRGETTHYDYVCQQVSMGCQWVSLKCEIPVAFGVLTVENETQAWDRLGGVHGHKGVEAADAALAMYRILKQI
jgi:6,7-dimethyl-8-ribityllumazine synthase